jgi:hypothetical protein
MGGAFNRAGNQKRKKADKDGVVDEIPFGFDPVVVKVQHVGQTMKSVEGNTHGQDDIQCHKISMNAEYSEQIGK